MCVAASLGNGLNSRVRLGRRGRSIVGFNAVRRVDVHGLIVRQVVKTLSGPIFPRQSDGLEFLGANGNFDRLLGGIGLLTGLLDVEVTVLPLMSESVAHCTYVFFPVKLLQVLLHVLSLPLLFAF